MRLPSTRGYFSMVMLQIWQWRRNCHPSPPLWYETIRKTTHVIFWS